MTWDGTDWWLGMSGWCGIEHTYVTRFNARGAYDNGYYYIGSVGDYSERRAPGVVWNGRGHTFAYGTVRGQFLAILDDNFVIRNSLQLIGDVGAAEETHAPGLVRRGANVLAAGLRFTARVADRALNVVAAGQRINNVSVEYADAAPHANGALLIGSSPGIVAQLVDDNLGAVGAANSIAATNGVSRFDVKAVPDGYVVAWTDLGGLVWARHLNANGAPDAAAVRISLGFEPAGRPSIAAVDNTVLIAWPQQTAGNDRVYMRAYTNTLAPKGAAFAVGASNQEIHAVSIAPDDTGRVAAIWMEERPGFNPRNRNLISVGRFQCREP